MIYTVGYQHWNRAGLDWVVGGLKALLLDVRSLPKSRKPGFGQRQLQATFGESYRCR